MILQLYKEKYVPCAVKKQWDYKKGYKEMKGYT